MRSGIECLQIGDCSFNDCRVISERTQPCIAEQAENTTDLSGAVIVVDLGSSSLATQRTQAALLLD
jgi:hypothetical protein